MDGSIVVSVLSCNLNIWSELSPLNVDGSIVVSLLLSNLNSESELEIQINSREQELVIPESFSDPLKDLIRKVLNKNPTERITALDIINHPFFATEWP